MKIEKIGRNILLFIFFCFYTSVFLFSTMHLDLSRDVRQAFQIVNGESFPLNGQIFGGRFRLGPVWYYFLATLVWLFKSWLLMIMALATLAGTQVFFAYLLGKDLQDRQAGMIFAALVLFPSWGFFEQLFPTHVMFVPALTIVVMISAVRYAKKGKSKYIIIQALAFSLALHAHPTALIVLVPALYFNFRGFRYFECSMAVLLLAVLVFLLPFFPMIFYQAKSGFPLLDQMVSHAEGAAEAKDWAKIYLLPLSVLSGTTYISNLLHRSGLLLLPYAFTGAVFFLLAVFDKVEIVKNIEKVVLNHKANAVFLIMVGMQSGLLVLLSSGHAYYYTATLRLFIFASIAVVVSKILAEISCGKYFLGVLVVATLFSSTIMVYGAARWAAEGVLPVNIFPLADVSAKKSPKTWLPAVAAIHEAETEQWLCKNKFLSLHGSLASHLIYNYAIESYFGCTNKKLVVGNNFSNPEFLPSYLGISSYLGHHVSDKVPVQVGSMHIHTVLQALGTAFIPNSALGTYPPYFETSEISDEIISISVVLQKGEILALTDLSHDYLQRSKAIVQTDKGEVLKPFAFDMQTKIYQCQTCDVWKLNIIFESNLKNIIDIVVF